MYQVQTEAQSTASTSTPILKKTRVNTPDTLEEETDKEAMVSFRAANTFNILLFKSFQNLPEGILENSVVI